jgi:hypothetical protein
MTANPFHGGHNGLIAPIDMEKAHPITAHATNTLQTTDARAYIPRALVADVAGTIVAKTPTDKTLTLYLIAGYNPIGGMDRVTTITTITSLLGVE